MEGDKAVHPSPPCKKADAYGRKKEHRSNHSSGMPIISIN